MAEQEIVEDTGDVIAQSLGVDPQAPVKDVINEQVQFPWLTETKGSYAHEDIDAALQEEKDAQKGQAIFDKYTEEQLDKLEKDPQSNSDLLYKNATDVMDDDVERTVPKWMSDTMKEYGILTGKVMSPYDEKDDNIYHTIQTGDTLSEIAEEYGVEMKSLLELNPQIKDADQIFAGDSLRMKKPIVEPFGFTWEKGQEQPEPATKTPPHQKGVEASDIQTWNAKTNKFETSKKKGK
jgi:LysM repeat protein